MTWEVVVWDGVRWFRSEFRFETRDEAQAACDRIHPIAPVFVASSRELDLNLYGPQGVQWSRKENADDPQPEPGALSSGSVYPKPSPR